MCRAKSLSKFATLFLLVFLTLPSGVRGQKILHFNLGATYDVGVWQILKDEVGFGKDFHTIATFGIIGNGPLWVNVSYIAGLEWQWNLKHSTEVRFSQVQHFNFEDRGSSSVFRTNNLGINHKYFVKTSKNTRAFIGIGASLYSAINPRRLFPKKGVIEHSDLRFSDGLWYSTKTDYENSSVVIINALIGYEIKLPFEFNLRPQVGVNVGTSKFYESSLFENFINTGEIRESRIAYRGGGYSIQLLLSRKI